MFRRRVSLIMSIIHFQNISVSTAIARFAAC
jgi:hypothetical protein